MQPTAQIDVDLLDAFVAEAQAQEAAVLTWADALVTEGSKTLADALASGFRAKVPIAGGAIGSAVETALASLDTTAEGALKTGFDAVIAGAKAKSAALQAAPPAPP
jgi:hypothetical protein